MYRRLQSLPLIVALWGCVDGRPPAPTPQATDEGPRVRLAQVDHAPVTRVVRATGLVGSKHQMNLAFKVGGVLASLRVERGQQVSKGQVLAHLDGTEVQASMRQAWASEAKAKRDHDRLAGLSEAGQVPMAEYENSLTSLTLARASVATADFNRRHSTIVAPADGWIERRNAEEGEIVAPGQPIFRFVGQGWVVRIAVSDRDILGLQLGAEASVRVDADTRHPLHAVISEIARSASPLTGTFEVEVRIEDDHAPLLSGLSAKVEISHPETATARVPLAALVSGHGMDAAVFVYDAQSRTVHRREVRLDFLATDSAAVAHGLEGADMVVTDGATAIRDGQQVRPFEDRMAAAQP